MNPFELEALKNHPDTKGPVYMVNLLKYREKSLDGDGSGVMRTTDTGNCPPLLDPLAPWSSGWVRRTSFA